MEWTHTVLDSMTRHLVLESHKTKLRKGEKISSINSTMDNCKDKDETNCVVLWSRTNNCKSSNTSPLLELFFFKGMTQSS